MPRLRRTFPDQPGWTRRRAGKGFAYLDQHGHRLDAEQVQRCKDLVIPPAWKDVWITPYANGHLQAVGTDDAGRRQYLYHPQWRASRDAAKFDRILLFGKALSKARERVLADIGAEGMSLERACAVAVRLLDLGYFRIGNDVYTDTNGSFGLTTLRKDHVSRHGGCGSLRRQVGRRAPHRHRRQGGDRGPRRHAAPARRRRRAAGLEGRQAAGATSAPSDVNDYIRTCFGIEATAKDFRTWHATVIAAAALAETDEPGKTKASRKRAVSSAMKEVSEFLGNTPTLARTAYVDPRVVEAYERGRTIKVRAKYETDDARQAALERAVLKLLAG